jgi:hypothetical protein
VDDIKKRYPHIESGTKPEKTKENIDKERPWLVSFYCFW